VAQLLWRATDEHVSAAEPRNQFLHIIVNIQCLFAAVIVNPNVIVYWHWQARSLDGRIFITKTNELAADARSDSIHYDNLYARSHLSLHRPVYASLLDEKIATR
jgi:hypothetical protein